MAPKNCFMECFRPRTHAILCLVLTGTMALPPDYLHPPVPNYNITPVDGEDPVERHNTPQNSSESLVSNDTAESSSVTTNYSVSNRDHIIVQESDRHVEAAEIHKKKDKLLLVHAVSTLDLD